MAHSSFASSATEGPLKSRPAVDSSVSALTMGGSLDSAVEEVAYVETPGAIDSSAR